MKYLIVGVVLLFMPVISNSEIVKRVNPDGSITYTNNNTTPQKSRHPLINGSIDVIKKGCSNKWPTNNTMAKECVKENLNRRASELDAEIKRRQIDLERELSEMREKAN